MPTGQLTALAVREFVAVGAGRHLPRPSLRVVSLDKLVLLLDGELEADIRPPVDPSRTGSSDGASACSVAGHGLRTTTWANVTRDRARCGPPRPDRLTSEVELHLGRGGRAAVPPRNPNGRPEPGP
jgi:hypothetical protein